MFAGLAAADPSLMYVPFRLTANRTLARENETPLFWKFQLFMFATARFVASVIPDASPLRPVTAASAEASAAFWSSVFVK